MVRRPGTLAAAGLAAIALGCAGGEPDLPWPGWRGPGGMGVSGATDLPTAWEPDSPNLRWSAAVPGMGNSSPVAAEGRVFLTSALREGQGVSRWVLAWDLASGEELWRTRIFSGDKERRHPLNTYAAPTPVTDGERLWVYFGSHLASLDLDGRVLWVREIDPDFLEHSRYGAGSSPVLAGETVIIFQDREYAETEDPGWLAAFDRDSGERLWRREWMDNCCSYSTPLILEPGSGTEILLAHSAKIATYAVADGEPLWSEKVRMLQPVPTPVMEGDLLCAVGGGNQVRGIACMRLERVDGRLQSEVLWRSQRMVPNTPSPVLYGGHLYVVTEKGVISCYDPVSGKTLWRKRLPTANYHSSLVAGDGKLYASNLLGRTAVVEAAPRYSLLAYNDLGEQGTTSSPAIAGGCLLVRTKSRLVCIEGEAEPGPAVADSGTEEETS